MSVVMDRKPVLLFIVMVILVLVSARMDEKYHDFLQNKLRNGHRRKSSKGMDAQKECAAYGDRCMVIGGHHQCCNPLPCYTSDGRRQCEDDDIHCLCRYFDQLSFLEKY
ncbi:uncharacterized protein LOC144354113 [Saccoglossus kowalevskii]